MTGPLAQEMRQLLTAALAPTALDIINDSASHS
ncbi:MAG: BolA family transcriptional regulator, partial [Novosphingobium sp.]